MNKKMTFCEECRKDVTYSVEIVSMKGTLKGEEYSYTGKKATCTQCGTEVYVAEIEDENLKMLYDAYRLNNGIISLGNIMEIPQKYTIGKRPLSLLLGWGEMTFTRYYEGDMPTKQYSNVLQRIFNEPAFYLILLEENKGNLKSQTAYEKSRRTTLELLGQQKNAGSKEDEVIDYLLFQCEDITPLALQKALYYIQGFFYAFMDSFLLTDDCEAWVHGPVYREIYNRYSGYRFDSIESDGEFDVSVFTNAEKAIIDSVIQNFCCYSGKILEKFTHAETPWLKTRGNLPADTPSNRTITKETIGEYFTAVKQKYSMLTPNDIENYAQIMFSRSIKS
ncbi:MAG: type II toxin-antitoxin system antitoxin SocA domain-containing protein [Desulfitobacteriaceae bacterium]